MILVSPVKRKAVVSNHTVCPSCSTPIKRGGVAVAVLIPEVSEGKEVLLTRWAHQDCVEALEPPLFAAPAVAS